MTSALGLIDANNFYASAERVFDPRLARRPVVVLSNNDGCIVARSKEAKQIGIPMGAALFEYRRKLEAVNAAIMSSNYTLYDDMSRRFQEVLDDFTPDVEHYSIDECFVKMPLCYHDLAGTGHEMRNRVRALSGIPVSVGFAATKTLAKLAVEIAKKSDKAGGVVNLVNSPYLTNALERVTVGDVWGIGRRYAAMLESKGITTALQFRDADSAWIRKQMTVVGARTQQELRGTVCIPFEPTPKTRQQICCSRTFGDSTTDFNELRAAVAHFAARAAEKLREHRLVAGSMTVFLVTDRFKDDEPQYSGSYRLSIAPMSNSTLELLPLALMGLEKAFRSGFAIRKAGVWLDNLEFAEQATRRLWDVAAQEIHQRLMAAIDGLNQHFGGDTVRCGLWPSAGVWRTRASRQSPNYTTDWRDLMVAH